MYTLFLSYLYMMYVYLYILYVHIYVYIYIYISADPAKLSSVLDATRRTMQQCIYDSLKPINDSVINDLALGAFEDAFLIAG